MKNFQIGNVDIGIEIESIQEQFGHETLVHYKVMIKNADKDFSYVAVHYFEIGEEIREDKLLDRFLFDVSVDFSMSIVKDKKSVLYTEVLDVVGDEWMDSVKVFYKLERTN